MTSIVHRSTFLPVMLCLSGALTAARAEEPLTIGSYRQLFVDDHLIQKSVNVRKVLHPARKDEHNPLIETDQPWDGAQIYTHGSVIRDDRQGFFRMWYAGWAPGRNIGLYATSKDGIHWDRPALGLVDYEGSTANNLVDFFSLGLTWRPEDPDPDRRYKAIIYGRPGFSADGLRWQVPDEVTRLPGDIVGDNVIPSCYDEQSDRYLAFPKVNRQSGAHLRRSVALSLSNDFLTWTSAETVLVPDQRDDQLARARVAALRDHVLYDDGPDWHIAQFYVRCGFPYEGMYLGLLWVFDISGWPEEIERRPATGGEDGPVQVQLTSSRDLRHWERAGDRELLIPVGKEGTWEAGQIYTVNRPIVVGDEIWIYYGGIQNTHFHPLYREEVDTGKYPPETRGGIGLARLRLDGWVSVDAGDETGSLTTKPLRFDGKDLVINAVAKDGWVTVAVLDQHGEPHPGFSAADCQRFSGDRVRHVVSWKDGSDISQLRDQPVRLRFQMKNASLYSFATG